MPLTRAGAQETVSRDLGSASRRSYLRHSENHATMGQDTAPSKRSRSFHAHTMHPQAAQSMNIPAPTIPPFLCCLTDTKSTLDRQALHISPIWKCLSQI
ncbi:hypothetical protein BU26DRAFT_516620 [Trematosphaeria pertusa]|uniref:Uncharacterized protein n=1 Tax=Trematosphaeria pertusa TaxID=390896 RepID=A0A6A6IMS7_9PLEO|nr:uncharacterized protein BU26DRAFT_516620 [Trematosphaeria pertusa]KAF2251875.1 hypothetical protein BU26DRAFT_516620 [Trematosphaeria pertusa]